MAKSRQVFHQVDTAPAHLLAHPRRQDEAVVQPLEMPNQALRREPARGMQQRKRTCDVAHRKQRIGGAAIFCARHEGRLRDRIVAADRARVVEQDLRPVRGAIAALAAIAIGGTYGLGRRWQVPLATALVVAMIGLSVASQLLTLGSFFT